MTHKQVDRFLIFLIIILSAACLYLINREDVVELSNETQYVALTDSAQDIVTNIQIEPSPSVGDVVFDSGVVKNGVVGYFAYGAFVIAVPDWMVNNWYNTQGEIAGLTIFSPRATDGNRDFSDIVIYTATTTETMNAAYLFEKDKDADVSEILLSRSGDFRIYHTERQVGDRIYSTYYIDGNGKTGTFQFDADVKNYYKYSIKIKEFINGIGVGEKVRG